MQPPLTPHPSKRLWVCSPGKSAVNTPKKMVHAIRAVSAKVRGVSPPPAH